MPHLSRHKVKHQLLQELYAQLIEKLGKAHSPQSKMFEELLTETEKIMLAKRLALISLLSKGHSFEQISAMLKISPSTIARFSLAIENGKYDHITEYMTDKKRSTILDSIVSVLATGMRPIHAPRWKWLDKDY